LILRSQLTLIGTASFTRALYLFYLLLTGVQACPLKLRRKKRGRGIQYIKSTVSRNFLRLDFFW
jgi:hypothetical protein